MALRIDACAAQHQGDRKEQQDRVAIMAHPRLRGTALAIVADGMGGHTGGALAAEQVIHTAKTNFDHFAPAEETPADLLGNSMREAHTMIKASRFMNEKDPHSTVVMLLLQPDSIHWSHCGDSRLYHFRNGQLQNRTVDHSYVEHLIALGRITPEQALSHPNRNILMTSLGGQDEPKFSYSPACQVVGGDDFVLCSDGVWAYFDDAELGRIIAENTARQACETLISLARARSDGQGDNLSLAVIRLIETLPEKSAAPVRRI